MIEPTRSTKRSIEVSLNEAERSALADFLDIQRAEVAGILTGLSENEARERLVPSLTTPLGLVKHAIFVEQVWFHSRVAGVPRQELGLPTEIDESFTLQPHETIPQILERYHEICSHSRQIASVHDLDAEFPWHSKTVSLRFIYIHMIAELARHAGHGDILVEQLRAQRTARGH